MHSDAVHLDGVPHRIADEAVPHYPPPDYPLPG
jgi:hypothetical protein